MFYLYLTLKFRYEYVDQASLTALRDAGELVFEGVDRDEEGNKINVQSISLHHSMNSLSD